VRKNPVYSAIAAELDAAGIRHIRTVRGKHEAVTFDLGGRRQCIIMPSSPSDWRAPHSARSHLRRVLKAGGTA
jgi:hypothetical protein